MIYDSMCSVYDVKKLYWLEVSSFMKNARTFQTRLYRLDARCQDKLNVFEPYKLVTFLSWPRLRVNIFEIAVEANKDWWKVWNTINHDYELIKWKSYNLTKLKRWYIGNSKNQTQIAKQAKASVTKMFMKMRKKIPKKQCRPSKIKLNKKCLTDPTWEIWISVTAPIPF